ncbi:MAG: DUF4010 domain-containing protein [archaeon]
MFEFFSSSGGNFSSFLWRFFLTIIVALPIGLEREKAKKFAGLRTSLLVASLGFFSSFLARAFSAPSIVVLGLLFSISVALLIYYARSKRERHPGLTTSTAFVLLFCLGLLVELGLFLEAIAASIILTLLLAIKPFAKFFVKHLSEKELIETLALGFFSFIMLPVLPNRSIDPWGIFNPFVVWSMTLLVLALGFAGHLVARIFKETRVSAGIIGAAGGLASLIATTFAVSENARKDRSLSDGIALVLSVAFSVTTVRVLLLSLVGSREVFAYLIFPLIFVSAVSLALSMRSGNFSGSRKRISLGMKKTSPFSFSTAIRFTVLFTGLVILFKLLMTFFGKYGLYAAAAFAGFGSLNALVVSITSLSAVGSISPLEAAVAILIGCLSSAVVNLALAYRIGGAQLGSKVFRVFGAGALLFAGFIIGLIFIGG